MSFYSNITISPLSNQLDYRQSLLTIGSCFSEQIGNLMTRHRFDTTINPLGILYNPHMIAHHLATAITSKSASLDGYVSQDGLSYHHDFHSSFRDKDREVLAHKINNAYQNLGEKLKAVNTLIITLGTAIAYRKIDSSTLVGNCHKVPQSQFTQTLISERAITTRLSTVFCALKEINPHMQVILTVSPVRYLKFGAVSNNRSKAQLLTAAMKLEERHNFVSYWPAYEIFMDELRDYRWVESDLVHPNQQAIQHIWSRFAESALTDEAKQILKEVTSINAQLKHRPFNPTSSQHLEAQKVLRKRISNLKKAYPYLRLSEEEIKA